MSDRGKQISAGELMAAELISNRRYPEAFQAYKKLSDEGIITGQVYVAWMLYEGIGTAQDRLKAIDLFRQLAENDVPIGMFYLAGTLASEGRVEEAFKWYQRAAAKYYSPALFRLGVCYIAGIGVEPDKPLGIASLEEAARAGHLLAKGQLARLYLRGEMGWLKTPVGLFLAAQALISICARWRRYDLLSEQLLG